MKKLFYLLLFLNFSPPAFSQAFFAPDTLLTQNFQDEDFIDLMLPFPLEDDEEFWINFNADLRTPLCGEFIDVPARWYIEFDFGKFADSSNLVLSSCSYTAQNGTPAKENWLILPRIFVPDTNTVLYWESLSFQGPAFLDGYQVLVSTGSNDPIDLQFTDTLFTAAEMLASSDPFFESLDLDDYTFSDGYIHADGYTLTDYFDLDTVQEMGYLFPFYRGALEPHLVSLKPYVGQHIFIAFLHDSHNNYLLQLDNINVVSGFTSNTQNPAHEIEVFSINPNPVVDQAQLALTLARPMEVILRITDAQGKTLIQNTLSGSKEYSLPLPLHDLQPGLYHLTILGENGHLTKRFIKL